MKIGILGGTFNPLHNGHLLMAHFVCDEFSLDKMLIMPNHIPGYKDTKNLIPDEHRLNLVQIGIMDDCSLEFSDLEYQREGTTYTADTLRIMKEGMYKDDELFFLMGEDSFKSFHKWVRPEEIISYATLVVMRRSKKGEDHREEILSNLKSMYPNIKVLFSECPFFELSSTDIRNRLYNGQSVKYMIPDKEIDYIVKHHLYKDA